jgi:hypothetical protein
VLGHECLGELELRLHDLESVLLEHELGRFPLAKTLSLEHEPSELSLQDLASLCGRWPQLHTSQCGFCRLP